MNRLIFLTFLLLLLTTGLPAHADYIPPGEVSIQTKAYQPAGTNFPRGTYEYAVKWEGLPVARAAIEVSEKFLDSTDYFNVTAKAKTGGIIAVFYKLRHVSKSIFRADSLTPVEFTLDQTENSKRKAREVKFGPQGLVAAKLWKDSDPNPDERYDFHSANATFDPISAAFVARSLPITIGEELSFDVFNGKHRFLITLQVEGRETIRVEGKSYDTFKVTPKVKKLTDSEGEKRLRSCTIWVTADDRRDVVRIKSEVFVGSVAVDLIRFVPTAVPDPGMVRASLSSKSFSSEPLEETKVSQPKAP